MAEETFSQTTSIILKDVVLSLFYRYKELSAKDVQEKLKLKRQTTYTYLKKLEEEGRLVATRRSSPSDSRVKTTYYSLKPHEQPERLSVLYGQDYYPKMDLEEAKKSFVYMNNMAIGLLLENRMFIDALDEEDTASYLLGDPELLGPGLDVLTMGRGEYEEFTKRFQIFLEDYWREFKDVREDEQEYVFFFGGFKPLKRRGDNNAV